MKAKKFVSIHNRELDHINDTLAELIEFTLESTVTPAEFVGTLELAKQLMFERACEIADEMEE